MPNARQALRGGLVTLAIVVTASASPGIEPARAQVEPPVPPCASDIRPAVEFVGLPRRVITGKQETFRFERVLVTDAEAEGPYQVRMVGPSGRAFFDDTLPRLSTLLYVEFDLNDRWADVSLTYTEYDVFTGIRCERTITRRAYAQKAILFPSLCYGGLRQRPRRIIIACADAGFILTSLRWRRWGKPRTTGRGLARINDCNPFCAAGTYHYIPVRTQLSELRRCRSADRYVYTRLRYRLLRRPAFLVGGASGRIPFPCRLYEVF